MSLLSEFLRDLGDETDRILESYNWDGNYPMEDYYKVIEIKAEFIRAQRKIKKLQKKIDK